jgi:two-component system response regulator FlrC
VDSSLSTSLPTPAPQDTAAASAAPPTAALQVVWGDPFTAQLLALADRVARTEVTVLIGGPSGTGKEVLATYLHQRSLRAQGRFVAFNCACLPESMVEDLLFGHEKGAFTGALQKFEGFFAQADGGTLFLDEVGELPLHIQAKLLRVLQEREFTPLGATRPQKTNFRLLAATNRDLKSDLERGSFREDLYYRLNIFPLTLKPLAQRPGDILPLAQAMLQRHRHIGTVTEIDPSATRALIQYPWPGNVRELENVIQRALIIADGGALRAEHLGFDLQAPLTRGSVTHSSHAYTSLIESESRDSLMGRRSQSEAELIREALQKTPTKMAAAARLGISERTLRYKLARMREHGLMAEAG